MSSSTLRQYPLKRSYEKSKNLNLGIRLDLLLSQAEYYFLFPFFVAHRFLPIGYPLDLVASATCGDTVLPGRAFWRPLVMTFSPGLTPFSMI